MKKKITIYYRHGENPDFPCVAYTENDCISAEVGTTWLEARDAIIGEIKRKSQPVPAPETVEI